LLLLNLRYELEISQLIVVNFRLVADVTSSVSNFAYGMGCILYVVWLYWQSSWSRKLNWFWPVTLKKVKKSWTLSIMTILNKIVTIAFFSSFSVSSFLIRINRINSHIHIRIKCTHVSSADRNHMTSVFPNFLF
jgi:hypothetical protein